MELSCICNLYFFEMGGRRDRGLPICWTSYFLCLLALFSSLFSSVGTGIDQQLPFLGHSPTAERNGGRLFSQAAQSLQRFCWSLPCHVASGVLWGWGKRRPFLLFPFLLSLPALKLGRYLGVDACGGKTTSVVALETDSSLWWSSSVCGLCIWFFFFFRF